MNKISILTLLLVSINNISTAKLPEREHTINAQNGNQDNLYILSAISHDENLPENAIIVEPQTLSYAHQNYNKHDLPHKKIIALPLNDVENVTQLLNNTEGYPVLAEHTGNSNEDMMVAESIVFRPLFVYRKQLAKRKRIYQQKNGNRRRYSANSHNQNPPSTTNQFVWQYPYYYPDSYRSVRHEDNFPVLS